ncbi:MAG: hypothetical protein HY660_14640 [Armatimonadetes bacterium]|nr:hypothetical protein [Armatimonadota bacterium]
MRKLRPQEADVVLRLMNIADIPQNVDALQYMVFQFDFKDYNQFVIECPPGSIRFTNFLRAAVFCDNLGYLVEAGIVPEEPVLELFPIPWNKMEPVIQGMRHDLGWPDLFDLFERLGQRHKKWREAKYKRLKIVMPPPEAPKPAPRPPARPMPAQVSRSAVPARPAAPGRVGVPAPGAMAAAGVRPAEAQRPAPPRPAAGPPRPAVSPPRPAAGPPRPAAVAPRPAAAAPRPAAAAPRPAAATGTAPSPSRSTAPRPASKAAPVKAKKPALARTARSAARTSRPARSRAKARR